MVIGQYNADTNFPIFFLGRDAQTDALKQVHDAYDIYADEQFIGKKVLLTQTENIDDVLDFLRKQGLNHLSSHLEGDHYIIESNDEIEHEELRRALSTYLENR